MADHANVEVSIFHWQVINTEGRRATSKASSAREAMRALNSTILVTAVMEPLTWENNMELVRGNDCVVDTTDNPCTRYLINNACVLAERDLNITATTNGVSSRGGGPILLVSGSAMGTEGEIAVYNHRGEGGATNAYTPSPNYESENRICCYR